ncbi:MAG TPA: hypothetical protein VMT85_23825 [Thermoanaerobaculia bacterium]|nr:hypothetical protein [Thermoanaerobaculia bacterium]
MQRARSEDGAERDTEAPEVARGLEHILEHVVDLDVTPPPWDYNPSSWRQRVRVAVVAIPGFLVSVYLGLFDPGATLLWVHALAGGAAIAFLALASMSRRLDRLHLGILAVAAWLAGHTFLFAPAPTPAAHQNQLVVALLLAMVAILPTRSAEPPASWVDFYARRKPSGRREG